MLPVWRWAGSPWAGTMALPGWILTGATRDLLSLVSLELCPPLSLTHLPNPSSVTTRSPQKAHLMPPRSFAVCTAPDAVFPVIEPVRRPEGSCSPSLPYQPCRCPVPAFALAGGPPVWAGCRGGDGAHDLPRAPPGSHPVGTEPLPSCPPFPRVPAAGELRTRAQQPGSAGLRSQPIPASPPPLLPSCPPLLASASPSPGFSPWQRG